MPFLIDGHNLIPKVPGLSLQVEDDEQRLISLLQDYCRAARKDVEVFFDRAPLGQAGTRSFARVKAHFVRQGQTADAAIANRLTKLGKQAANWTVVSSDGAVQASARRARAQVLSSESFAAQMMDALRRAGEPGRPEPGLSPDEMEEWLRLFGGKDE